jgi:predicted  nucleic acid-binding Zn-ribbon protein
VAAAESSNAREIDVAAARLDQLGDALGVLERRIADLDTQLEAAEDRVARATAEAEAAEEEIAELEQRAVDLEAGLENQAIRSFRGDSVGGGPALLTDDPNRSIRMQALLAKATETDVDFAVLLEAVRDDLQVRREDAERSLAEAGAFQSEAEKQLAELRKEKDAQSRLAAAAEARVEHLLGEQAALARLEEDVANGLVVDIDDELLDRLASVAPPPPASGSSTPTPSQVSRSDIATTFNGLEVHVSILDDMNRLFADAAADGINLSGGGYRDPQRQIAVRRNNCGTSDYDIWQKPSSQCRPPTARPGRSMHEQGKAIDFTYNGRLIRSRSGPGWQWLKDNAWRYGLKNLPSEPWHWSTNGR